MDSARESELTPPLRSHPSGTARIEQSEKCNRGRRMDLVLGLSEEGDEESSGEDEYDDSHGQGSPHSSKSSPGSLRDGEGRSDSLKKIRKISQAVKTAELMAKKRASLAKEEALKLSEKGSSLKIIDSKEVGKKYVVSVEDLNPATQTTIAKENTVPSYKSSRISKLSFVTKLSNIKTSKSPAKSPAKGKKSEAQSGQSSKQSKFMARYGLQKYAKLFKPV